MMSKQAEKAYRAYRRAADKGYGSVRVDSPERMARIDARIRGLKARYEALLARDAAGPKVYP